MSGSSKEKLQSQVTHEETGEEREVYLRDGRKLVVGEQAGDQLVEIRSPSGMLEVRIKLTDAGPVLQMDAARLELKATEAVQIEGPRVEIKGAEQVQLTGAKVQVTAEDEIEIEAKGDVRVRGKMIWLN